MTAIKNYKHAYGHYPANLEETYFHNISKHALIRRPFHYRIYTTVGNDTIAQLSCASFNGNYAGRSSDTDAWFYWD